MVQKKVIICYGIWLSVLLTFSMIPHCLFAQYKTDKTNSTFSSNSQFSLPKWLPTANLVESDILYSIALGANHMLKYFNPDLNNAPSFYSRYLANGDGEFDKPSPVGVSHVIGRGLLAIMLVEEVVDIPFPDSSLKIYEGFLQKAYDNPASLNSFIDSAKKNAFFIDAHSMREGLYGLLALMKARNREWAWEKAALMVKKLAQITDDDGHWSPLLLRNAGLEGKLEGIGGADATTSGRIIEPLLEYYKLSGNVTAWRLAGLYAKATLKSAFTENGDIQSFSKSGGHIHSLTSSLCGIVKYAAQTRDTGMLQTCIKILENGIKRCSSSWGWVDEVTADHPANRKLRGEVNQSGDVIRAALVLGHVGYTKFYEVAERFLRNMLLQSQHNEVEMKKYMRDKPDPLNERERDILTRNIGGYSMPLPNDRMQKGEWVLSTLDVTSGAVHALCEVYRNCTESNLNEVYVNFLFDMQTDDIEIKSYLPLTGKIRFFKKNDKDLYIRIPDWVNQNKLRLEILGKAIDELQVINGYLHVGKLTKGAIGTIMFDISPVRTSEEIEGTTFNVTWWGDQVIEIDPAGRISPIPFDNR